MGKYLIRRFLLAIVTIFGVTIVIFLAMRVLPGDPLAMIYGEASGIYVLTEEELAAARASLGLDQPLHMQYLNWMKDVFKGDLGYSFWIETPIRDTILRRGPITAEIALLAIVGLVADKIIAIAVSDYLSHKLEFPGIAFSSMNIYTIINFESVFQAMFMVVIAEVFRTGAKIREENELTI